MAPNPRARFRLLRRFTIAISATSVAVAGLLYLQVSGTLGGLTSAVAGGVLTTDPASAPVPGTGAPSPGDQGLQVPAANPGPGTGQPVATTGGS